MEALRFPVSIVSLFGITVSTTVRAHTQLTRTANAPTVDQPCDVHSSAGAMHLLLLVIDTSRRSKEAKTTVASLYKERDFSGIDCKIVAFFEATANYNGVLYWHPPGQVALLGLLYSPKFGSCPRPLASDYYSSSPAVLLHAA